MRQQKDYKRNEKQSKKQETEKHTEKNLRTERKGLKKFVLFTAISFLAICVLFFASYQSGYIDQFVKSKFIEGFDQIGIQLKAEKFSTRIFPLGLHLENVEAINKTNGEALFRFDSADIKLTLVSFFSPRTQININSTEISGAKIIIKFNAEGRSNFSGLGFAEQEEGRFKLDYASAKFALKDSLIQFGDQTRKIEGEAKNFNFQLQPVESKIFGIETYDFSLFLNDSSFSYDGKKIESISLETKGKADEKGAEVEHLKIKSPTFTVTLTGKIEDWQNFKYNFDANADLDLTQLGNIFAPETGLNGIGIFKGKVTGEGETYKIEGEIFSDSLAISSFNVKQLELSAIVKGKNSIYEASGEMIAEMLNSGEFQIYFPRLISEVRGDGNFLRFLLELQAKAVKSSFGTVANLYVSDAVAEYNEQKLRATLGSVSVERFFAIDSDSFLGFLRAKNVRLTQIGERSIAQIPKAEIQQFQYGNSKTDRVTIENAIAENTKIDSKSRTTQIETDALKAKKLKSLDITLENLTAKRVKASLTQNNSTTVSLKAESLEAERLNSGQAQIKNLKAQAVGLTQVGDQTYLNSKLMQIGKLNAYGVQLASLNIAGVRLSILNQTTNITSEDIEAGDVRLNETAFNQQGGKLEGLRFEKPVFVLEPSGRYRASLDVSLGGGFIGNISLGKARASIIATNNQIAVNSIAADVMDGKVTGNAVISFGKQKNSTVRFNFSEIDLSKFAIAQSGRILPLSGKTNGTMELSFPGTDFKKATGLIEAKIATNAGKDENSKIPISGEIRLTAENGLFSVNKANLETGKTRLWASGEFSLQDEVSDLNVLVFSSDASEVENLIVLFALSPELEKQLAENKVELAGNFYFDGKITGRLDDPTINGKIKLDSIKMRDQDLGSLESDIFVASDGIEIKNGKLEDKSGGFVAFDIKIPQPIKDNVSVQIALKNYDSGSLLSALPLKNYLPESFRQVQAKTSGEIVLKGLPNKASGSILINSTQGTIAGQPFDSFSSKIVLNEISASIEKFEIRQGKAFLIAKGNYDGESTEFDLNLEGKNLQVSRLLVFIPNGENLPAFDGVVNFTAQAKGEVLETSTYNIFFNGEGSNISINGQTIGSVDFQGITENQLLKAVFAINYENSRQEIFAEVNFADETLPIKAYSDLSNANLTPFLALYKPSESAENLNFSGTATGKFSIEGKLADKDAKGNRTFSLDYLNGFFDFSALSLQINEIPLALAEPLQIRFNRREMIFDNVKFVSAGSILSISGTKALQDNVANNLSVNGRINLRLLDIVSQNTFFGGVADISVRLTGLNQNSSLSGNLITENGSLSTFIGNERLDFERIKAKIIFTANQIQIAEATGYLGSGKVTASGGALLKNLELEGFRLDLVGKNVTAPLPKDFITTGNAEITIVSRRIGNNFDTLISGNIFARRSIYTKDIDLADVIGARREASIRTTTQDSSFSVLRLELNLIGRDALIVRNNIADLVASVDMKVTGNADNPILIGRITSNEGTLFYRDNKYSISRGTLEFPIQIDREPFITLQAETEIQSYQIAIDLRGELSDFSSISLNVRSTPPLPQADIVSLITTGSLSNTETGIPTIAQSGINTAAEILTDALVNTPIRKATDRLFGLNRFELSPIISGIKQLPTARLTVGRQINRNLLVTYSTNLSEDQRQVIALEYRVSNRLSFLAQYQQKSLSNFVQERNSFNFEIRLRRRF
jgi:translocation and assembly module TamB